MSIKKAVILLVRNCNKLLFIWFLICTVICTGCASAGADMMTWHATGTTVPVQDFSIEEQGQADAFSKGLCIIPKKQAKGEEGVSFSSAAQLCINITDKKKVYADNIYERLYPASVTKLFSAYVILKYGNLDDTVEVGKAVSNITEVGAKLCNLEKGDRITLRALLEIMLVYSANDAAVAAAEAVAGSEEKFVQMMNDEAAALGASGSHFVNSHGLHDEDHYTTAYDIYLVFNALVKNKEFRRIICMEQCSVSWQSASGMPTNVTYATTNRFLLGTSTAPQGMEVLGGKTGTTQAAGACLAMYSKGTDGKKYISVILKSGGNEQVFSEMARLMAMAVD